MHGWVISYGLVECLSILYRIDLHMQGFPRKFRYLIELMEIPKLRIDSAIRKDRMDQTRIGILKAALPIVANMQGVYDRFAAISSYMRTSAARIPNSIRFGFVQITLKIPFQPESQPCCEQITPIVFPCVVMRDQAMIHPKTDNLRRLRSNTLLRGAGFPDER